MSEEKRVTHFSINELGKPGGWANERGWHCEDCDAGAPTHQRMAIFNAFDLYCHRQQARHWEDKK